ncbi:MAG TPA: alpha/beta fold hydrolase [Thermomicrobiales bacterium]|nr:alpha/beta fold hydrolase [Thermomicrobiales bacterium]
MSDDPRQPDDSAEAPEAPVIWRRADRAWRLSARLTPRHIDWFLRVRSGRGLPGSFRARFLAMGLPPDTIDRALGEVRRLDDWLPAWNRAAQRYLAEARREDGLGHRQEAAIARRNAAMCYHVAHLITDDDPRTVRALRAAGVQAFSQAIQRLMPHTRKVGIPWRATKLPAYLAKPQRHHDRLPAVVFLNGATTTKEETLLWTDHFLERGLAVLALDWPGTGETAGGGPLSSQCDDITDGIVEFAESDPDLDPARIALVGISLGGVLAVRAAALDRRIDACVTVTSPYDARRWIGAVNPIVGHQLLSLAGQTASLEDLAADFALTDVANRIRCPILVFGAGHDLVVPPDESLHLSAAAGDLATLIWYPEGSHGLYEQLDDWTTIAARWLATLFKMPAYGTTESTRVDAPVDEDPVLAEEATPIPP